MWSCGFGIRSSWYTFSSISMVGDFPLARHGRRARDDGSPGSVSQSVLAQPGDLTEAGREREKELGTEGRKEGGPKGETRSREERLDCVAALAGAGDRERD